MKIKKIAVIYDESDYANFDCNISKLVSTTSLGETAFANQKVLISACKDSSAEIASFTEQLQNANAEHVHIEFIHEACWNVSEEASAELDSKYDRCIAFNGAKTKIMQTLSELS